MAAADEALPLMYEEIRRRLMLRIRREWKAGHQLPPIPQLAREMGVGVSNTQRAVRSLAEEGLLLSRPRRGTFVAEAALRRKPAPGRTQRANRRRVFLPFDLDRDGMVHRMTAALIETLEAAGQSIRRGPGVSDLDQDFTAVDADAIVLVQYDLMQSIRLREDQSVIMINTSGDMPGGLSRNYDLITVDHRQGALLAGEHLRKLGITRACVIRSGGGIPGHAGSLDAKRLAGFEAGFGGSIKPEHQLVCTRYTEDEAANMVPRFIKMRPRPEAVFATCDEYAVGFLIGAAAHQMLPRRDYQLVGFDGQARGKDLRHGPLTTVAVPAEAMGRQAAECLLSRLADAQLPPRAIALGCTLFEGNTTRRGGG